MPLFPFATIKTFLFIEQQLSESSDLGLLGNRCPAVKIMFPFTQGSD